MRRGRDRDRDRKTKRQTEPTIEPKQRVAGDETKASESATVDHKIKKSIGGEKEKMADRAARESKKGRQGEAVNSLPWRG